MNILIAYGTTEGQTRKISRHVADVLQRLGHTVTVNQPVNGSDEADVSTFDAVIVAASVHQQRYQPEIYRFVSANADALRQKPTAFISVSLSLTVTDGTAEAERYCEDFAGETGWRADMLHLAEGAVRYMEYDFFKVQTIEHIVFKGKKEMPPQGGNPEFTDWDALDAFATAFAEHADSAAHASAQG